MASDCSTDAATADASGIPGKRSGICISLVVCILFIAAMKGVTYNEPVRFDAAVYSVIGHELLNGRRLYSDLWDHKPPAIHATFALAELVVGYGPQQLYLLHITALTITLLGLYRAGVLLGGPRAGLGAAVVFAIGSIFPNWEGYHPNTEVFVNTLLVWSFYLVCRLSVAPRWWLACAFGAATGVASLYKQVAIAPAGLIGLAYILRSGPEIRGRWLALAHMLVAAGVSMAVWVGCVAWFWSQGDLGDFYDAVFVYNRHYVGNIAGNLLQVRHKSYLVAVALPCLLVPLAAPGLDRAKRTGWFLLAAWAVGCFIAYAITGRWFEYYLEIWMPVYALAAGGMFAGLFGGQIDRPRIGRWALLVMVVGPLGLRLVPLNRYDSPPWMVVRPDSSDYQFYHSLKDAGLAFHQILLPGERMFAPSAPLYFYTRQRPPSGVLYDHVVRPGNPQPLAGRLYDRIMHDLDRDPPDLIVFYSAVYRAAFDGEPASWQKRMIDWVSARYSLRTFDPTKRLMVLARRGSALEERLIKREKP